MSYHVTNQAFNQDPFQTQAINRGFQQEIGDMPVLSAGAKIYQFPNSKPACECAPGNGAPAGDNTPQLLLAIVQSLTRLIQALLAQFAAGNERDMQEQNAAASMSPAANASTYAGQVSGARSATPAETSAAAAEPISATAAQLPAGTAPERCGDPAAGTAAADTDHSAAEPESFVDRLSNFFQSLGTLFGLGKPSGPEGTAGGFFDSIKDILKTGSDLFTGVKDAIGKVVEIVGSIGSMFLGSGKLFEGIFSVVKNLPQTIKKGFKGVKKFFSKIF